MCDNDPVLLEKITRQNELLADILEATKQQGESLAKIKDDVFTTRRIVDGIKTMSAMPLLNEVRSAFGSKQLSFLDTLKVIADESLSFARFGDGELRNMFRPEYSIYFQRNSADLAHDLQSAMSTEGAPQLLVGMPHVFADHLHWNVVLHELWFDMEPFVSALPRFGNLHVTRPVAFQAHGMDLVRAWQRIWDDKPALIVTGEGSRFDLAPGLFDNLGPARFEYSLPRDAYADLDRIEDIALRSPEKLVLISLGPAGSVLAHRLAKGGKQALDVGHLSSSYSNVLQGGKFPERNPIARK